MATTLGEILETLQKVASAPEATPATSTPAPVENQVNEEVELRKLAEEYDAAGRIMAQAFTDELQKIAVGATGVTPNTAATPENSAVQLTDDDIQLPEVEQVVGQLRALTQGAEAKMSPGGKMEVTGGQSITPTTPSVSHDATIAFDVKNQAEEAAAVATLNTEKKASAAVEILYRSFFGN